MLRWTPGHRAGRCSVVLLRHNVCFHDPHWKIDDLANVPVQIAPFPHFFPSRRTSCRRDDDQPRGMAHSLGCCISLSAARLSYYHCQRCTHVLPSGLFGNVGKYPRNRSYRSSRHPIFPANLDDISPSSCGKFEHTYDGNSDAR